MMLESFQICTHFFVPTTVIKLESQLFNFFSVDVCTYNRSDSVQKIKSTRKPKSSYLILREWSHCHADTNMSMARRDLRRVCAWASPREASAPLLEGEGAAAGRRGRRRWKMRAPPLEDEGAAAGIRTHSRGGCARLRGESGAPRGTAPGIRPSLVRGT